MSPVAGGLFRAGDRIRSMRVGRMGYVRGRRDGSRVGDRYVVEWDGGLEFSLVRPSELELVWPTERGGVGEGQEARHRHPAAD